ncbi:hypothetical protein EDD22DRAFT_850596 [Suillus occidentalis]|nr:hypothetical protein EDD22DRAFT_850596 [Suillus occidentalis]
MGSDAWWRKAESQTADEPKGGYLVTCPELFREVCSIANALKDLGVKNGGTTAKTVHQLTQFYSAHTAIRLPRRLGARHVESLDFSAWNWYNEHVGKKQCAIVITFCIFPRQTKTGSVINT